MKIKLSPYAPIDPSEALTIVRRGDVLTIDGERFDFSALPEGATLPAEAVKCDVLASDVTRINGQLVLTLMFPCGRRHLSRHGSPQTSSIHLTEK